MVGCFFVEQNGCWSEVNGRRFTLQAGDLQVARGDRVRMGHDPARPITALSLILAVDHGVVPNILLQRKFARRYRLRDPTRSRARFEGILAALQSPLPVRDWAVSAATLEWLLVLLAETNAPLAPQRDGGQGPVDRVLFAQAWAGARLEAVITLANWARVIGWHPVHFERVFKQETGVSPIRWLEDRRLEAARQDLCGTSKTIAEIGAAVGYADPFYFSRVFRKRYGHSPRGYRQRGLELLAPPSAERAAAES